MRAFRHAGDLGDIIYSMPVARALANGDSCAYLIEVAGYTRQRLTRDKWCGLDELMLRQPYIADVRSYRPGEGVSYNLNDFRARLFKAIKMKLMLDKHLTHWMCEAHGVQHDVLLTQWLTLEDPIHAAKVVFARAGAGRPIHQVYHNLFFPWHAVWQKYHNDAVFIGTEIEHRAFCAGIGPVPHYKTATLLEAARVIAGCSLFVGNQTATHAIAEGLKKNILLEVWLEGPNCLVHRPGVTHGKEDPNITLPDL